ncbi:hypothetical protein [Methanococcoides sp. NM1]|uniref:hypothetical protein n=1 Tax=Methanococcoides sp. NM1 TaxID=1201013 RepID=UPI001082A664|nr:hypothetical protein [Methanococcoides sp. NM1]
MVVNFTFKNAYNSDSENRYELDPLRFDIWSYSLDPHKVEVNVFDENNNSIFNESYMINSSEGIYSPVIVRSPVVTSTLGSYKYVVTLDDNITRVEYVQVRYAQTLSSSDYLSIEIYDDEEEPLVFSIAVA